MPNKASGGRRPPVSCALAATCQNFEGVLGMPYVMVDVESDGPIPGDYSMICFGAIIVEPELNRNFYGRLRPISESFVPEALAVSGFTRDECLSFDEPKTVTQQFAD